MTKDWISVKDLASIKGVTERAVRKAVNQNKYVTRMVDGTTGAKYEILVESLDYNLQNVINFEKTKNNFENKVEPSLQKITQYPTKAKQIALARYDLVNLWVDYIKNSSLKKTESGKEFLEIYNKGEIYSALYKILGHVAVGTIYRWQKEIKNNNNFENLIPKYDYGEKEHSAKLTQNELIVFKSLLLSPNKVNIGKATRLTKHILSKRGLDSPSSAQTFRRFANNYRNKHYDEWIFAREGQKALRDKVQPYITSLECPNVKGKTIVEVFESGKGSGIDLEKLDDLMMSKEIRTINRDGIRFLNADYYNDCLYGLKERVQIKYSLLDLTKIKVYTLNNEFICYANRVMPIHPMAAYLGDVKDQEELKQKLKQQKSLEKQTVKKVQKHFKSEHIKPLEWQNKPTKAIELKTNKIFSNNQEEKVIDDISNKKFMTRYERYEWHLKNGFSNDKEVTWFVHQY